MSPLYQTFAEPAVSTSEWQTPAWLLQFNGKASTDLLWDGRFKALLELALSGVPNPVNPGTPLPLTVAEFLSACPSVATVLEDRFLILSGARRHLGRSKGLLWIDTHSALPSVGFVARVYRAPGEEKVSICVSRNRQAASEEIPPQFLATSFRWLITEAAQSIVDITIYDGEGAATHLDPPIIGFPTRALAERRPRKPRTRRKKT
jgi:hypothetical protein